MKKLPMVEIFETIQGEGSKSGHVTTFIRIFNCNLRCSYCDTKYSYHPHRPEFFASTNEILLKVMELNSNNICLTGGEPLLYTEQVCELICELSKLPNVNDIHIETNGAISIRKVIDILKNNDNFHKVRFIMDYKLSKSGEKTKMIEENLIELRDCDELKFVVHDEEEFFEAIDTLKNFSVNSKILFSPVYGIMSYEHLANLIKTYCKNAVMNIQLHKIIWNPETRGV